MQNPSDKAGIEGNNTSPSTVHSSPLNPNNFNIMAGSEASTRRQRIAMACQYCRHRKIKCCGSSPCANCTRARRACDYSPVPEEVNRATREKKAAAKAAKQYAQARAAPYFVDQSVYSMPYLAGPGPIRGTHVPPRRSYSTPVTLSPYSPIPHAPVMTSPAQFESPWFSGPPVPVINVSPMVPVMPSAGDHMPIPDGNEDPSAYATYATAPVSPTESSSSTSYPMPVTPVRKPIFNTPPHTPSTAYFQTPNLLTYTPQPFPFSPSPLAQSTFSTSPTLCPGLPVPPQKHASQPQQPLVGLGIGLAGNDENYGAPPVSNEYLSASNAWTHADNNYY